MCSISGDFLENYCEEDDMANIARLFVAVFVIALYPLECHGGREVLSPLTLMFETQYFVAFRVISYLFH